MLVNWIVRQILPEFNCCGSSAPYEKEITAEIKRKPNRKTNKPSISHKQKEQKPYTSFKQPKLIQSISNSADTDFAKLEEQNPPQIKSSFTEKEDYDEILKYLEHDSISDVESKISEENEYKISDIFTKIDDALCQYYQNNDINDYDGKFLKYIIKHKLDPNNIEYELGDIINANDCIYIRFDYDNFPLNNCNKINKNEQIFNVLQYCYQYGIPPSAVTNTSQIDTEIENKNVLIDMETDAHEQNNVQMSSPGGDFVMMQYTDYKTESDCDYNKVPGNDRKQNTKALKLDIHAKYAGNNSKIKRKISKLGDNIWQHEREKVSSSKLMSPTKILNEDTSWVKYQVQRESYHKTHSSIETLQLKKMISSGKIFTAFTPMTRVSSLRINECDTAGKNNAFHEGIKKWIQQKEATFNSEFNDKLKENISKYFAFNASSILAAKYILYFFKINVGLDFTKCTGGHSLALQLQYAFVEEFGIQVVGEWGYFIQLRDVS